MLYFQTRPSYHTHIGYMYLDAPRYPSLYPCHLQINDQINDYVAPFWCPKMGRGKVRGNMASKPEKFRNLGNSCPNQKPQSTETSRHEVGIRCISHSDIIPWFSDDIPSPFLSASIQISRIHFWVPPLFPQSDPNMSRIFPSKKSQTIPENSWYSLV